VECICPAFAKPVTGRRLMQSNLCTYDHAARKMYATVAFSLTGGNLLKWFRDEFGQPEVQRAATGNGDAYALLLEQLPPHPTPLQVLPYFTPSGTPYFDPHANGAIMGLTLQTSRCEILKALLEGVALEMRLNLDILQQSGIPVRELRATGGGSRSRRWNQLKADILNRPLTAIAVPEAGCLGAAMLACAARTANNTATLATTWVKLGETFPPNPENTVQYDEKFKKYRRLYHTLKQSSIDT
ncbi:MAG: FGGY-family carbohydrate kinase, partial [Kiritimatiellia bacterium]